MRNTMTIVGLLRYLHQRMLTALAAGSEDELNQLSGTLMQIWEAAEHYEDRTLYELLDDMNYVLNETLMDARPKGERRLASVASKLKQLEDAERTRI